MRGKPIMLVRFEHIRTQVNEGGGITMRKQDTLRLAGGTRGIKDVSKVGCFASGAGRGRRGILQIECFKRLLQWHSTPYPVYKYKLRCETTFAELLQQTGGQTCFDD